MQDLLDLCHTSRSVLIQKLKVTGCRTVLHHQKSTRKTVISSASIFQSQLDDLTACLQKSQCQFVRCLNPNLKQLPHHFDHLFLEPQLSQSGIFEAVRMIKYGYSFQLHIKIFVNI